MDITDTDRHAGDVVDRLWRAYAPFQRGRNTLSDLTSMLAILLLAAFVESEGTPEDEFVGRWARAVTEARHGASPLTDLRAALSYASEHPRFPVSILVSRHSGLLDGDASSDDLPWAAPFVRALAERPTPSGALQKICEQLLERHVQEHPYSGGEFHTPRGVVRLLIDLASPQPGDRILDPACGTGGFLAAAAQRVAESGRVDGATFEAYTMDHSDPQLAMLNMALHGVARPVVRVTDPVSLYQHRGTSLVDKILSNPPFNQRIDNIDILGWPFGQPPKSSANFAWIQLAWSRLSEKGAAAIIMPPAAAWSTGREAEIRKQMVAHGALLSIIALPPNLFYETSIPVHIWMLSRDKTKRLPRNKKDVVLFIDAGELGTQTPRQPRKLTKVDIDRISVRFTEWLHSANTTPDEQGFSRSVSHEEILDNDGSLDPRLYVSAVREPSTAPDLIPLLNELSRSDNVTSSSLIELRSAFDIYEQMSPAGAELQRIPLRAVLAGAPNGAINKPRQGMLLAGPSGTLIRADDYVNTDGIPVVMPKDLTDNGFSTANVRLISEHQAEDLERFRLHHNDIVVARRGDLGRCAVVREEQQGWVCGTGCFVLRPPTTIDADYLAAYLRSPEAREWLASHSTGTVNMKTISLNVMSNLPVAVPDIETQRKIAGAIKQLDAYERLLRAHLALTQSIRRDAIPGLLTSRAEGQRR
ncbi:N-6 DNA methylase [Actinomadura nitritigenes]|uniref:type I restriction-modification system subunit M/S n=1 Tax=Actinomadura nitritigenes TaxID=134602 RepID=UPI003D944D49